VGPMRDSAVNWQCFAKRTIDVPACFIAGAQDWGIYQKPGAVEKMRTTACKRMLGFDLVPGAGHWVQQEQPEAVTLLLLRFLKSAKGRSRAANG